MTVRPYTFGAQRKDDSVLFRLFAPSEPKVALEVEGHAKIPMRPVGDGFLEGRASNVSAGTRYRFVVNGRPVPDPASRRQSGGVHGWSVLTDDGSYSWHDQNWRGRPWEETVLYEMHIGLAGGFERAAADLEHLRDIGLTALELMPIAAFPGTRNWGYDGVLPYAPSEAYGTPDELKALIDRAHGLGISVFLDVVYNHFGPDGNYLSLTAPEFFREDVHTPWGAAIDFRREPVRRFFIENALYWLTEFRFDGLRLDAVHAITPSDWLKDLTHEVRAGVPPDRHVHLIVEDDHNDPTLLRSAFDAQWNDDLHHVLHVLLTGERHGYYADFVDAPAERLARALAEGFVYQGEFSKAQSRPRGARSSDLPPTAFVSFLQNHDQIGNRAHGERLTVLADEQALKAAVALLLLAPQIPLVFMGEEIGSQTPFLYFTDHGPRLAQAVREGRAREFAFTTNELADPNSPETFEHSRPKPGAARETWLTFYRDLLRLRHEEIGRGLEGARSLSAKAVGPAAVVASWRMSDGMRLTIACNLGEHDIICGLPSSKPIWGMQQEDLPARRTIAWLDSP